MMPDIRKSLERIIRIVAKCNVAGHWVLEIGKTQASTHPLAATSLATTTTVWRYDAWIHNPNCQFIFTRLLILVLETQVVGSGWNILIESFETFSSSDIRSLKVTFVAQYLPPAVHNAANQG
jgi:hypothetical protein